ncbi:DHH family phosphoesterase [Candidatus Berkelbacteria bacterium]|nr:DHH family phosphoesterase [Candidatus Berkelbacteria bacterium]
MRLMELTPKQQTVDLIRSAKRIVVVSHQNPDGDAIGSTLALTLALRKLGKDVQALCADPVPPTFRFLPAIDQLSSQLAGGGASDFVITINTGAVKVDKLGYKNYPEQQKLNIVIKTASGELAPEMVSFSKSGGAGADLIIVLDTNDVERMGSLYKDHAQLFYQTPIVNIDHHPGNGYFGKVNWVDLGATSTAEILVSLLESLGSTPRPPALSAGNPDAGKTQSLLDADIATLLLTGITTDTGSFQNTNTTPKSFTVAAQLVAAGARQQEIVQHIYKTKPLSTLKLWGKILSSIREDRESRFIWSKVSSSDFAAFGASETETSGVVDELLKTVPNIDFALLLSEKQDALYGSLRGVNPKVSVADVAGLFGGGGHEMAAAFRLTSGSLADNETEIIEKIRRFQAGQRTEQPNQPLSSMPTMPESGLQPSPAPSGGRFALPT